MVDRNRVFAIPPGSNMPEGIAASGGPAGGGDSGGVSQANGEDAGAGTRSAARTASAANEAADVTQAASGGVTGDAIAGTAVGEAAGAPGADVIRRMHPSGGAFDVVIVQAAPEKAFHPAAALSGKPVYTVYLEVGAPKPWVLQFCVPAAEGAPAMSPVVNLADVQPVKAPYPMVTFIQPALAAVTSGYNLVHGFISANGRFRDLKAVGGNERAVRVLPLLEQWEFRPAMLGSTAVDVEVLLAIPTPGA
jgi:hypothetical protein